MFTAWTPEQMDDSNRSGLWEATAGRKVLPTRVRARRCPRPVGPEKLSSHDIILAYLAVRVLTRQRSWRWPLRSVLAASQHQPPRKRRSGIAHDLGADSNQLVPQSRRDMFHCPLAELAPACHADFLTISKRCVIETFCLW